MKPYPICALCLIITIQLCGQTITGKVIDYETGSPIRYVSIGIIDSGIGCITDKEGCFTLSVENQPGDAILRFSMISYEAQTFTIERLANKTNIIKLRRSPIKIDEVKITPSGKTKKIGTNKSDLHGGLCGWNCAKKEKPFELGLKLELGPSPVQIKSLHVNVHRQAFDTSKYRLHIRSLKDGLPNEELLTENIIFPVTKESGWVEINLKEYNVVVKGEVALSLEWLEATGRNDDRAMKINDHLQYDYILLKTKKKSGFMYSRWGREGKWNMHNKMTPSIYLTVAK